MTGPNPVCDATSLDDDMRRLAEWIETTHPMHAALALAIVGHIAHVTETAGETAAIAKIEAIAACLRNNAASTELH